jgi:hypothetical protein
MSFKIEVYSPLITTFKAFVVDINQPILKISQAWPHSPEVLTPITLVVGKVNFQFNCKATTQGYPYQLELIEAPGKDQIDHFFSAVEAYF